MTFWSSLFPTLHADEEPPKEEEAQAEEEEEEEEPEDDPLPELREECKQTAACSGLDKHFAHCTEKVTSGQGFKGEDCVEEFLMHCVDVRPSTPLTTLISPTPHTELRRPKTIQQTPLDP
ncbi:ubiquinol-cytochrome C reductase hinge protein [Rhizoctonia solani]|uniref:Ubiquinol-cytochrome C reductase hinge protein n=1 Tax=Rhizoctonia solani TaxID=456999 RepID=A0A8H8P9H2_9AGAM|nr:ubiquinol-cytochrome C reductase hinge protein [Rhizoctonia solani]QRW26271.1 ubiquinol-cytochrome C reductase hinge protein [Rhizoctonia solani]